MLMAMPIVLFPALATQIFHAPAMFGLLYSAEGVGALTATATSGWTSRVHHHGRAIVIAASVWGGSIALAGLMPSIWLVLACLVAAGAADMVSGLFRSVIWNQTFPDSMRGRLAGIELLSFRLAPSAVRPGRGSWPTDGACVGPSPAAASWVFWEWH